MKKLHSIVLLLALSGCNLTPEQQQALAASMQGAGQAMSNQAAEMRQRQHEQSLQQQPSRIQTNCTTGYNPLNQVYETVCQ